MTAKLLVLNGGESQPARSRRSDRIVYRNAAELLLELESRLDADDPLKQACRLLGVTLAARSRRTQADGSPSRYDQNNNEGA